MSAFLGERDPLLRYIWILDDERLFADSSWLYYFKFTEEMVRKRKIQEVRALLVVESLDVLEEPQNKLLLAFFRNTRSMDCRVILEEEFRALGTDGGLLSNYIDFGIYGAGLIFRTETYEPQTAGVFSKDRELVTRYTRFFDDFWTSGTTLDNPSESRERVSVDELIQFDTYGSADEAADPSGTDDAG